MGLFALIVYTFPWLGLIFIPIGIYFVSTFLSTGEQGLIVQYILSSYYRRTTREIKRVHSLLRSLTYNCLQEQVSVLIPTVSEILNDHYSWRACPSFERLDSKSGFKNSCKPP